ncbi:MAG: YtxH domain-containing protein [Flavobacteriaceae bacterium]
MSDEKSLGDDLNDMLGDAKEGARKAAKKAEEFGQEAKEKAKEFADDAKEKFNEFAEDAKEKSKEIADDAKEVLSDGKNIAIIAHITLIGWIIALVMNGGEKKTEFASFYIRQMLGLMIIALILNFIPVIGWIANIGTLILWIISLIGALGGEKKETPAIGHLFQNWFKSI